MPHSLTTINDLKTTPPDFADDGRFRALDEHEGYYRNTVYDARPFNWDGSRRDVDTSGLPLLQSFLKPEEPPPIGLRKPSVVYNMTRLVVDRFVSLLWGEHRFPRIRVDRDKTTEEFLQAFATQINMKATLMEAATLGGMCGSVLIAFKVIKGKFQLECFNPKWVTPLWEDFHAGVLSAYRIMYPFQKVVYDTDKEKWVRKWFLYRRVVTDVEDTTFLPQELKDPLSVDGNYVLKNEDSPPVPDESLTFMHNLGFVPAVFIQNLPRYDEIDGDSTCEGAYGMFDCINELLSSITAALHGNLDPTLVLSIEPKVWRELGGQAQVKVGSAGGGLLTGEKGTAKYLEFTGEGITVADTFVKRLRDYALEVVQCVIADPERISGNAQSAAAITKLFAHMLAKADVLRNQYGEFGLKRLIGLMLLAIKKYADKTTVEESTGGVRVTTLVFPTKRDPDSGKAVTLKPNTDIIPDDITLQWGEYFEPLVADVFQAVESAYMAMGNKPVSTLEVVAKYLAPFLGDHDPHSTIEMVRKQCEEDHKLEMELAKAGKTAASGGEKISPKTKPEGSPTRDQD